MLRHLYTMSFKSEFFRIILKLIAMFFMILICDLCLSSLFQSAFRNVGTGELSFQHVKKKKYDILIFGASKSTTNYDPKVISKETNLSCYSLGSTGSTFLAQYPQILSILEEYSPKLIVFELTGTDLNEGLLSYKQGRVVDRMLIHSDRKSINDLLKQVDKWHWLKSKLKTYKYTSVIADRIVELFRNKSSKFDPKLGFNPKERDPNFRFDKIDALPQAEETDPHTYKHSPIIEKAFTDMLLELRKREVHAIFLHSPNFRNMGYSIDPKITQMIEKNGMAYYDMALELSEFDYNNYEYYSDMLHMSSEGASVYSRQVGLFIKNLLADKTH